MGEWGETGIPDERDGEVRRFVLPRPFAGADRWGGGLLVVGLGVLFGGEAELQLLAERLRRSLGLARPG